jgi:hypothetical protein
MSTGSPYATPRERRLRPVSAHDTTTDREWRRRAYAKLPVGLPSIERVHTTWATIKTDLPWTNIPPAQPDRRCEVMRHVQARAALVPGLTAADRLKYARQSKHPISPRSSWMHVPEVSAPCQ